MAKIREATQEEINKEIPKCYQKDRRGRKKVYLVIENHSIPCNNGRPLLVQSLKFCDPKSGPFAGKGGWVEFGYGHRRIIKPGHPDFEDLKAWATTHTSKNEVKKVPKGAKVCPRCSGGGRYSWNARDLDRCYGCGGTGYVPERKVD